MKENRDNVLSDFVRMKIRAWEQEGREQQEIARLAQEVAPSFAKSTVAMVKKGQGVGAKTAPGFARAFGFPNVAAMVDAAHDWRRGSGGSAFERVVAQEAVQRAMTIVMGMQAGTTPENLRAIVAALAEVPRFQDRDTAFWVKELLQEYQYDVARELAARAASKAAKAATTRQAKVEQAAWREAGKLAKLEPTSTEPPSAPQSSPAVTKPKRRHRAG